ncbi:hypothetical protein [Vibrio owensii]|uniref:Uncharacterized protein n=1 Tax=Vibrio owensii CAIM 1854 = LMG 25443 TaxID=1229493 RepID=A0A0C1ZAH6_9VIBR|nr:hypothetical protein [Vibrio owensii]KIF54085.1 hypothetical protein H735_06765 [Vibrio owensii CAIM 1854 = LMG 25443]
MIHLNPLENKRHLVTAQSLADKYNITLKLHHKYGSDEPAVDVFVSTTIPKLKRTIEWHRDTTTIIVEHDNNDSLPDYVSDIRKVLDSTLFTALIP